MSELKKYHDWSNTKFNLENLFWELFQPVFEKFPKLISYSLSGSYEYNDEGGSDLYASFEDGVVEILKEDGELESCIDLNGYEYCSDNLSKEDCEFLDELYVYVQEHVDGQLDLGKLFDTGFDLEINKDGKVVIE